MEWIPFWTLLIPASFCYYFPLELGNSLRIREELDFSFYVRLGSHVILDDFLLHCMEAIDYDFNHTLKI